ncbi:phosphate ABC transporter phosphate binding protein, partial [mine drainage metagenome]
MRHAYLLPLLPLLSLLFTAAAAPTVAAPAATTLRWRGDFTTANSLADGLAKAWARDGGGKLEVDSFNTISGIDQALDGKVDIAGSARPPFSGRPRESGLVFTPLAWDALVLITHRNNPVHDITLQQLYQVYMGYTTNWSQLAGRTSPSICTRSPARWMVSSSTCASFCTAVVIRRSRRRACISTHSNCKSRSGSMRTRWASARTRMSTATPGCRC